MHGFYALERSKDIVFINAAGPWNLKCALQYQKDYGRIVHDHKGKMGELFVVSGEGLFIPEVYEQLASGLSYSISKGLSFVAVVFENCSTVRTSKRQFREFYQNHGIEVEFFETRQQAYHWLCFERHCCGQEAPSLAS